MANGLTFGGSDYLGVTESSLYQGGEYTGSRILAGVARESMIMAATLGTFQMARGGSQGALYAYQGFQTVNAGRSGYALGTGIDQVAHGDNWGCLNIAGGTLGLAGGFSMASLAPELNTVFGSRMPLSQSVVTAEGTAMRNVVQFQEMEVRAVRDLSHLDQATLEAMQEIGFAPQTVNGKQIVLHHLNQNPAGPLVEMPRGNNNIWNTVQHPLGNTTGAGLTDAQRAAFDTWRTEYWQWRATQELNLRRVFGN